MISTKVAFTLNCTRLVRHLSGTMSLTDFHKIPLANLIQWKDGFEKENKF